jgi:UMF1 family MFS transporter
VKRPPKEERAGRREIFGWTMYDFASSAFGVSMVSVIFNQYFAEVVAGGLRGVDLFGWHVQGASFFAFMLAAGSTVIALAAPVLGAIADYSSAKKKFMMVLWLISVTFTATLYFVREGDYWLGAFLFGMACLGYYGSLNFYNAFLPEISTPDTIGRISGWGNALGFLGGGLILIANLIMIQPSLVGLSLTPMTVPEVTISVALWMGLFALPTFFWVRERAARRPLPAGESYLGLGFHRIGATLRRVRRLKQLSRYFLAYILFNDGISTALFMASIFGAQVLQMGADELILFFLLTQATGLLGSIAFGHLADWIGQRQVLLLTLAGWSLIVIWAFGLGIWGNAKAEFWAIGFIAGLVLGGNLVASRSLLGLLTPEHHTAEFYGFLGLAGRFAAIWGPLTYGLAIELTGSLQRSILTLVVFFIGGMLLLLGVDEREGIREKETALLDFEKTSQL